MKWSFNWDIGDLQSLGGRLAYTNFILKPSLIFLSYRRRDFLQSASIKALLAFHRTTNYIFIYIF